MRVVWAKVTRAQCSECSCAFYIKEHRNRRSDEVMNFHRLHRFHFITSSRFSTGELAGAKTDFAGPSFSRGSPLKHPTTNEVRLHHYDPENLLEHPEPWHCVVGNCNQRSSWECFCVSKAMHDMTYPRGWLS